AGIVTVDDSDTSVSSGAVPVAVPMFVMKPRSTSACVVVYVAVQVLGEPGRRTGCGNVTADNPGNRSTTRTAEKSTLPALTTRYEYVIVVPGAVISTTFADLVMPIAGTCAAGIVRLDSSVTAVPLGGVPVAVPVFVMLPAFTSACVVVYVAVHVMDAPGASAVSGQFTLDRPTRETGTST